MYFHLDQKAFSQDAVYEDRRCMFALLKSIHCTLHKSEELVLSPTAFAESCLCVVEDLVLLKPVVQYDVNHPLSHLSKTGGQGDYSAALWLTCRLSFFFRIGVTLAVLQSVGNFPSFHVQ